MYSNPCLIDHKHKNGTAGELDCPENLPSLPPDLTDGNIEACDIVNAPIILPHSVFANVNCTANVSINYCHLSSNNILSIQIQVIPSDSVSIVPQL